jgi:hypothetical protein
LVRIAEEAERLALRRALVIATPGSAADQVVALGITVPRPVSAAYVRSLLTAAF